MTQLRHEISAGIFLEIDAEQLDSKYLQTLIKAMEVEIKMRKNYSDIERSYVMSKNKTMVHFKGVYICLSAWSADIIENWKIILQGEHTKRIREKNDKFYEKVHIERVRRPLGAENLTRYIVEDHKQCGMLYQTSTSSHGTLDSPTPLTLIGSRMSELDIGPPRDDLKECASTDEEDIGEKEEISSVLSDDNVSHDNIDGNLPGNTSESESIYSSYSSDLQLKKRTESDDDMLEKCKRIVAGENLLDIFGEV